MYVPHRRFFEDSQDSSRHVDTKVMRVIVQMMKFKSVLKGAPSLACSMLARSGHRLDACWKHLKGVVDSRLGPVFEVVLQL